jgi:hypothetical protein
MWPSEVLKFGAKLNSELQDDGSDLHISRRTLRGFLPEKGLCFSERNVSVRKELSS